MGGSTAYKLMCATAEDLAAAIAAGVHLARVTVFADALSQLEPQVTGAHLTRELAVARSVQQTSDRCCATRAGCRHPHDGMQYANPAVAVVFRFIEQQ